MKEEKYKERIDKIIDDFSKVIVPSEESAKLGEKIFSLIGELQGETIGLKLHLNIETKNGS